MRRRLPKVAASASLADRALGWMGSGYNAFAPAPASTGQPSSEVGRRAPRTTIWTAGQNATSRTVTRDLLTGSRVNGIGH